MNFPLISLHADVVAYLTYVEVRMYISLVVGYLKDILKELNHCNIVKCISTPRTLAGGLCLIAWAFCLFAFLVAGNVGNYLVMGVLPCGSLQKICPCRNFIYQRIV